jgi:hypothetical protein
MMHFFNDAEIAHRTPGRVRLRLPGKCGDASFFIEAGRRIAELEGVTGVTANRHSLSIVIRHDDTFRLESVSQAIAAAALARLAEAPSAETELPPSQAAVGGRGREVTAMVLQFAVAALFGRTWSHVAELLARNLLQAALREIAPQRKVRFAPA